MPLRKSWVLITLAVILSGILLLTLRPYGGNVTALFHFDETMHAEHPAPTGSIVLTVPGYDGMLYYDIARRIPDLFTAEGRSELGALHLRSYAYQRILLPATAFTLSLGQESFLSFAFLLINVLALLGTAWAVLRWKPDGYLYALALALSPAALIALHFNLAEPLTLFLMTVFLTRYACHPEPVEGRHAAQARMVRQAHHDMLAIVLLSLLVLSREINVLFVGLLMAWTMWRARREVSLRWGRWWRDILLLLIPLAVFVLWHGFIWDVFGVVPFLMSADKRTFPFGAIIDVLRGVQGFNRLTLSSIAFFLGFVLPSLVWIPLRSIRARRMDFLAFGSVAFLLLMTTMAWDIWGSITSIGRVITPVYPLTLLYAARMDTLTARCIAAAVLLLGLAIGLALALTVHPYRLA